MAALLFSGISSLAGNPTADSKAQGRQFCNGPSSTSFALDSRASTESKVSTLTTEGRSRVKLDLIPLNERASRDRRGFPAVTAPNGTYGVEGHGVPRSVFYPNGASMSAGELATRITSDSRYQPGMTVYLMCCETGKGRRSFAQQLADTLGTDVVAPTEKLWPQRDGLYIVAPERRRDVFGMESSADTERLGTMKTFKPGRGSLASVSNPPEKTFARSPSTDGPSLNSVQATPRTSPSDSMAKTAALLAELRGKRNSARYLGSKAH